MIRNMQSYFCVSIFLIGMPCGFFDPIPGPLNHLKLNLNIKNSPKSDTSPDRYRVDSPNYVSFPATRYHGPLIYKINQEYQDQSDYNEKDNAVLIGHDAACRVNGVEGACGLKLNEFTFAGSHNSGSGAFGSLYTWEGIIVLDCFWRNQKLSITQQLKAGIRYFDFDTGYNTAGTRGPSGWWDLGILLVHCSGDLGCSYTKSFLTAMKEIDQFLGNNPREMVVVRLKDHPKWARKLIRENLGDELEYFTKSPSEANVKLSRQRNPVLGEAIQKNERIVLFINGAFRNGLPYTHVLSQVESDYDHAATSQCYSVNQVAKSLTSQKRTSVPYNQVQVDWYLSYGLCRDDLAGLCDGDQLLKLKSIYSEVVQKTGRPVNLVLMDYVGDGSGGISLKDVVLDMNKCNVLMYREGQYVQNCKLSGKKESGYRTIRF